MISLQPAPTSPIIVKLVDPQKETLYDVLFGALGLTGVLVVLAVIAAVVFGGALYWIRRRQL